MKLNFLGLLLPQWLPLVGGEAGLTSIEHRACYADESVKDRRQQQIYMMISWVTFSDKMLLDHDSKHLLFKKKKLTGVYLIVVLVSGLQQRESIIHIHISPLF